MAEAAWSPAARPEDAALAVAATAQLAGTDPISPTHAPCMSQREKGAPKWCPFAVVHDRHRGRPRANIPHSLLETMIS